MNRQQRWVVGVAAAMTGITALLPRDDLGRLNPGYRHPWPTDIAPFLAIWCAVLLAMALLLWVASARAQQASYNARRFAAIGAGALLLTAAFPPDSDAKLGWAFMPVREFDPIIWWCAIIAAFVYSLCAVLVMDRNSYWGTARRVVMVLWMGTALVGPALLFPRDVGTYWLTVLFGIVCLPFAVILLIFFSFLDIIAKWRHEHPYLQYPDPDFPTGCERHE